MRQGILTVNNLDTFLGDNPQIALLVRQIEDLLELHTRLVSGGKIPAYRLMGLHKDYSASHREAIHARAL